MKLENTTAFFSEQRKFQFPAFALLFEGKFCIFIPPKGRKPLSNAFFRLTTNPVEDAHGGVKMKSFQVEILQ